VAEIVLFHSALGCGPASSRLPIGSVPRVTPSTPRTCSRARPRSISVGPAMAYVQQLGIATLAGRAAAAVAPLPQTSSMRFLARGQLRARLAATRPGGPRGAPLPRRPAPAQLRIDACRPRRPSRSTSPCLIRGVTTRPSPRLRDLVRASGAIAPSSTTPARPISSRIPVCRRSSTRRRAGSHVRGAARECSETRTTA